ncbi:rRNA maturation RNase YbeY [Legionella sp. W05-934-2]|jgi:probable rRNA maturation factor|uniref:rRNA maturation RNase YbeY n=1 Tax=Legionella sp. W05-934-2 TaxID=1198649 RepID=UPI00346203B7
MSVDIQNENQLLIPIPQADIIQWVGLTLSRLQQSGDICICFVDETQMSELNGQYRNKPTPTNILSFPSELPKDIQQELNILGDMVICPAVLADEAVQLNKPLRDHWAHICVHGVLHLLGYDHIEEKDEKVMQMQEISILAQLNIPNPYSETEGAKLEH